MRMLTAFASRVIAARQHRLLENSAALPNDTEEDEDGHSGAARRLQEFSDTEDTEEAAGELARLPIVTNPRYFSAREEAGLPELEAGGTESTMVVDEEPVDDPGAGPSGVTVQWPARALPRLPLSYYRDSQDAEASQSSNETVEILPTPAPRMLAPLGLLVRLVEYFCVEYGVVIFEVLSGLFLDI